MTIHLSAEELELVLAALKDHVNRRRAEGLPNYKHDELIARLELHERELRYAPPGSPPPAPAG